SVASGNRTEPMNDTSLMSRAGHSQSWADLKVSGPRGLRFPREHRGAPELYLQKLTITLGFASCMDANGTRSTICSDRRSRYVSIKRWPDMMARFSSPGQKNTR